MIMIQLSLKAEFKECGNKSHNAVHSKIKQLNAETLSKQ